MTAKGPELDADGETERQAISEARAAILAGQYVEHDQVMAWVKSWFTPRELPPPRPR